MIVMHSEYSEFNMCDVHILLCVLLYDIFAHHQNIYI